VATLAKGLGGGLPIGACVARADLALGPGEHGSTFGGGPVPCSAALTVLDVVERDDLLANAVHQGDRLRAALTRELPTNAVKEIRGRGLLNGVQLLPDVAAADVASAAIRHGLLVTTAGPDVVRLTPPLIVGSEHVDEAAALLTSAIEEARG
jgi:acetylornithine/succinyldiaminopimelate/putrescine aminotransferase